MKFRTGVLIIIGYGDRMRTQNEVSEMFDAKYPDCQICQSTVSRTERKFHVIWIPVYLAVMSENAQIKTICY